MRMENRFARRTVQVGMTMRFIAYATALAGLTVLVPAASAAAQDTASTPALSARVILPSKRLAAGSTMQATVRVQNDTGSPYNVGTCQGPFQVALSNTKVTPLLAWAACGRTLTIPVGTSTYPVTVQGSYVSCGMTGPGPQCVNGSPPPLPPGKYTAKLYQESEIVRVPPPITVQVTCSGH